MDGRRPAPGGSDELAGAGAQRGFGGGEGPAIRSFETGTLRRRVDGAVMPPRASSN